MAATHISEADAINDFASVLARVRAGEEVVIESDKDPVALMCAQQAIDTCAGYRNPSDAPKNITPR